MSLSRRIRNVLRGCRDLDPVCNIRYTRKDCANGWVGRKTSRAIRQASTKVDRWSGVEIVETPETTFQITILLGCATQFGWPKPDLWVDPPFLLSPAYRDIKW